MFFNSTLPVIAYHGAHASPSETNQNCTPHEITNFLDWFTKEPPRYDIVLFCVIMSLYVFYAMAVVCDEYCIPALERISYSLGMSHNVAGATLLALATSTPEFFVHMYATFLTESDMGLGTVVGSAVFNAVGIISICGFYSGQRGICLDWWPITRDFLWYLFTILMLTIFLYDGIVKWYEALIMVITYLVNLTCTLLDPKLQRLRNPDRKCPLYCFVPPGPVADFAMTFHIQGITNKSDDGEHDDDKKFNFAHWPDEPSCSSKVLWVLAYPFQCVFFVTIPNMRRRYTRNCGVLCVLMCIVWIAALSYTLSWMLTAIGFHLFLPNTVMGITMLAVGTSVPEAISAIIVTKKGYGSMAACSSISSNLIDILFCMGLSWLLKCLWYYNDPRKNFVLIHSVDLYQSVFALFMSGSAMYTVLLFSRFSLSVQFGLFGIFLYLSYVLVAVSLETRKFDKGSYIICQYG